MLTQEEIEDLHLFVASPIFNEVHRHRDKLRLFELIKKFYPSFSDRELNKLSVGKLLFPERSNPVSELERTMSLLLPIVRQFIAVNYFDVRSVRVNPPSVEEIKESPAKLINYMRQSLALMRFYGERLDTSREQSALVSPENTGTQRHNFFPNLYAHFAEVFARRLNFNDFDEYAFCDLNYFMFSAEYERAHYESSQQDLRLGDNNLLTTIEQLDQFYLLSKLHLINKLDMRRHASNLFEEDPARRMRMDANFELTYMMVEKILHQYKYLRTPGISVYLALFEFLNQPEAGDRSDFLAERFSRLLRNSKHKASIPTSRLMDFNLLLRNYWSTRYNATGNLKLLERTHHLQSEQIAMLGPDQGIPTTHLQSIVFTAIKLRKLSWVEQVLSQFSAERIVGEPNAEIVLDILFACCLIAAGEVQKAHQKMPHYFNYGAIDDGHLYYVAATHDVKIRFELGVLQEEESVNMIRATTTRVKRFKTLPATAKDRALIFFTFANKIYRQKQKSKHDLAQIVAMRDEIANANVVEREWLLAKCDQLLRPKTGNK